jgi:uncharacterized protein (TIGR02646 family)
VRHLKRGPAPRFWTREQVRKWTQQWFDKNFESHRWAWPQYQGRRLNFYAAEHMESWHYQKCAFCETPLWGEREIEHFRPKTQHPLFAFVWRNLFLICGSCNQKKGAGTHVGCLKPDREDPVDYLWVNPVSLKMEPKPGISEDARQRAITTIVRYELDRPELSRLYKDHWDSISRGPLLSIVALVSRMSSDEPLTLPVHQRLAALRALSQPEQPFSSFIKSLLVYSGIQES